MSSRQLEMNFNGVQHGNAFKEHLDNAEFSVLLELRIPGRDSKLESVVSRYSCNVFPAATATGVPLTWIIVKTPLTAQKSRTKEHTRGGVPLRAALRSYSVSYCIMGRGFVKGCLAAERLLRRHLSARVVDGVIRSAGAGQNELADRDDLIAFAQQIF